jgi:hypothetical protein
MNKIESNGTLILFISLILIYSFYFLIIIMNYFNQKEILNDIKKRNILLEEENEKLLKLKKPINFNLLSNEQQKRFNTWQNKYKPLPYIGATGGHFGLDIQITSIGYIVIAYNWKGEELDLTEYEKF